MQPRHILIVLALVGCQAQDSFEMSKDAQGRTVRLNKRTGEIAVVGEDRLQILKTPSDVAAEEAMSQNLSKPIVWPAVEIPQLGTTTSLTTIWRDGQLSYRFHVNASTKLKKPVIYTGEWFLINLQDGNGFVIKELKVNFGTMSTIVDKDGKPMSYEMNDSQEMKSSTYQNIKTWNIQWAGFD